MGCDFNKLRWRNPEPFVFPNNQNKPKEGDCFILSLPNDINDSIFSYLLIKVKRDDKCDIYEVRVHSVQKEIVPVKDNSLASFFDDKGKLVCGYSFVKYEKLPQDILEAFERISID